MELINKRLLNLLLLLLIGLYFIMPVNADCIIWFRSAGGEPVSNITVVFRNGTTNATMSTNTTDSSGRAVHLGACINVSVQATYPSSGYSAVLSGVSVTSEPYINDYVTARVQVKNTLGSYLEGQDCSVSVYEANSSNLIHDYDTLCTTGEPYVDDSGNWVSPTECKFSDSMGWYYFKGEIKESMGFKYNTVYDINFICNGKNITGTFKTQLDKQPDIDKLEDFAQKQTGYIIMFGFFGFGFAFIVILLLLFYNKTKSRKRN